MKMHNRNVMVIGEEGCDFQDEIVIKARRRDDSASVQGGWEVLRDWT